MTDDQFVYLGQIPREVSQKSSLVREDKRIVNIRRSGLLLTSIGDASTLRLVDQKGKGRLLSIKIVTDNPYVQLLLEVDDWRNDGETPAELMYGGTGKQDYGLYALEGGDPAKGYTMLYTPMGGEEFNGRLRISLRNRLPKTKIYGNNIRQSLAGGLPFPVNNGHAGGASFSAPILKGATLAQLGEAMAMPHYGSSYKAPQINTAMLGNVSAKPGIDHPFVGQAGKPSFSSSTASYQNNTADENTVLFGEISTAADGTTSQILFVTNKGSNDNPLGTLTHDFAVGQRLFIRDGGILHFPGEITGAITGNNASGATPDDLPTAIAGNFNRGTGTGTNTQAIGLQLTVKPGIPNPPTMVQVPHTAGVMPNMGVVTAAADTDPKILIKSIEIKYKLEVSYDG